MFFMLVLDIEDFFQYFFFILQGFLFLSQSLDLVFDEEVLGLELLALVGWMWYAVDVFDSLDGC